MHLIGEPRCDVELLDHVTEAGDENWPEHEVFVSFKTRISTSDRSNVLSLNRTFSVPLVMLTSESQLEDEASPTFITRGMLEVEKMLAVFRIPALCSIIDKILDGVSQMADRRHCFDQLHRQRITVLRMVVNLDLLVRQLPNIPASEDGENNVTDISDLYNIGVHDMMAIDREIYSDFPYNEHGSLLIDAHQHVFSELETERWFYSDDTEDQAIDMNLGYDDYMIRFEPSSEDSIKDLQKVIMIYDINDDNELIGCPICLEDIEVGSEATRLPCSHHFHGDCIGKWLRQSKFCPLCRFQMPTN